MTETGQKHVATVETIQQLYNLLEERIDLRAQEIVQVLCDALCPVLIDIRATIQALQVMPISSIEQSITHAVSAGIPYPTIREISDIDLQQLKLLNERLERIEHIQTFIAGGVNQTANATQLANGLNQLTQLIGSNQQAQNNQQAGDNQQMERLIDALQRAVNQGLNATPHATPLDRSTGSSRVLHVTVATPNNATPDATPPRRSTGVSKVLQKKAATPDGKRALIKEFYAQWPDASLNDCEQALGIERSTVSRIRKALKESGGL